MAHLSLSLLGSFQATLDAEPITAFESNKVRALLIYLAAEADRPHQRDYLAGMLWPDQPDRGALSNLRYALSNLRHAIGDRVVDPPFLLITRQTLQFNTASDHALDVADFGELSSARQPVADRIGRLERGASLYRDEFLTGFAVSDSVGFDDWVLLKRQQLNRRIMSVLHELVGHYLTLGAYDRAEAHAWRLLELEPYNEEAHRLLMRTLALSGRRSAALSQFETCRRVLKEELGVEPADETRHLYAEIQSGALTAAARPAVGSEPSPIPSFLQVDEPQESEQPVFVARECELAQLDSALDVALAGNGHVVFVTGEAGTGKSALLNAFARRAREVHLDLLLAGGSCSAHTGVGDPYLPFREMLGLLTGDVEGRWAARTIPHAQAVQLWNQVPLTVPLLIDHGTDLINTFVPGGPLLTRARQASPRFGTSWLALLQELVARQRAGGLQQTDLFEQVTRFLQAVAAERPLVITLDNLQWADAGSINLLFHLGQRLGGSRILIIGAYRPVDVSLGRGGDRHPLDGVVNEFRRGYGDIEINLDNAGGRQFVDAFLDTEPHLLGTDFRESLLRRTSGHPLFTVELLREMQTRGDLVRDEAGHWIEGPTLDWSTLPARVEGVIDERISRLEPELRDILRLASVEGETFTVQVLADLQGQPERQLLERLVNDLGRRHRLIAEHGVARWNGFRLYQFRFCHHLFQQYLYRSLTDMERELRHGEIAATLEALYEGHTEDITVQLAHHYARARQRDKAVDYLVQAGDRARELYAHEEAADYYTQALEILRQQQDYERAARILMKLGLTHHIAFDFQRARNAYDEGLALWQRIGQGQPSPPSAPHALRMDWEDPVTLDPAGVADTDTVAIVSQLFTGLVEQTPDMDIVPGVARAWDILQDGHAYKFYLRDDAVWTDGTAVSAADFEYAWKRALDPVTRSPAAHLLYAIAGAQAYHKGDVTDPHCVRVTALDATTLMVELEEPTSYFLNLLAAYVAYPVPKHAVERWGDEWHTPDHLVTNGPFALDGWLPNESLDLVRNPHYTGRFAGNVDRVELSLLSDQHANLARYEDNALDVFCVWRLPTTDVEEVRQRHAGEYISRSLLSITYLGFDATRPPFDDLRVRRAFALATNRDALVNLALRGYDFPATGGLIPSGLPGHVPGIALRYDPEQARRLLAEAGYPEGRGFPTVEALTTHMGPEVEFLRAHWHQVLGVDITWKKYGQLIAPDDLSALAPKIFRLGWMADYPDPDSFLRACPHIHATGWRNEGYERLVREARRMRDQADRLRLYQHADRILIREAAIVPLTYCRSHNLVKPWVKKYPMSPMHAWFWKDVIIRPHSP
jgi:ABC-type oligopeptide transport system substrate-binding subunit/DNA-binding SARP family transcriptional activator